MDCECGLIKMNEYTYKIPTDGNGKPIESLILRSDGAWIPVNLDNADYQAYLQALEEEKE